MYSALVCLSWIEWFTQHAEARQGKGTYLQSDTRHCVMALALMDDTEVVHQDMNTTLGVLRLPFKPQECVQQTSLQLQGRNR